jgi:hypothetical protein
MSRKKWVTEDEMYKIIESSNFFGQLYDNFKLLKQPTINKRYDRPDYILLTRFEGRNLVLVVEVKITLTASSIAQMEKYLASIDNGLGCSGIMSDAVVRPIFIYQWIDSEVLHFGEDFKKEWTFYKLAQKNKRWELEEQCAVEPKKDEEFLNLIASYFEVKNG